jgi:hypothetical protein
MKNERDMIDVALSTIVDHPSRVTLPARMVWLRGIALERQRAAERSLRITSALSAAGLLLFVVFGVFLALRFPLAPTAPIAGPAGAAGAVFILAFTALQLIRTPR